MLVSGASNRARSAVGSMPDASANASNRVADRRSHPTQYSSTTSAIPGRWSGQRFEP